MGFSITLSVQFTKETWGIFNELKLSLPWEEALKDYEFECADSTMTVNGLAIVIEMVVKGLYSERGQLEFQVFKIWHSRPEDNKELQFQDHVSQHLKSGDTVIVDAQAMKLDENGQPEFTDQDLEGMRRLLRFDLNDRVVCNVGPRWLSGHVVGTAVADDLDFLPYLVKTDPLPGFPSRTISVPADDDRICAQEICFDPTSQLHLVKAATAVVSESSRPKLRFATGEKVVCRIRNDPKDGLEQWVPGTVSDIWAKLSGDATWDLGSARGKFSEFVPYKIDLTSGGWIYCHRDDHTLIRRQGMEPLTRVKGISKRMEVRKVEDGIEEKIDHVTERRKRMMTSEPSDSD